MNLLFVTHHRRPKTVFRSAPMARELVRRGHRVTLLCIAPGEKWRFRESEEEGVLLVETPDWLWGNLRSGWDPWDTLRRIGYLRGNAYDLIHAFETRPATIYPVLSLRRRVPTPLVIDWIDWWGRGGLIRELRPGWYQVLFGGLETYFEEHFRTKADGLTVISSALAERAESLGVPRETIYKIRDGAEPDFFVPQDARRYRSRFGIPENRFVLGFSAVNVNMDTRLALETTARIARTDPDVLLIMTGNKPSCLEQWVQELSLSPFFRHLGFLPYADLPLALSTADVFLLPFPNKPANRGRWPHKIADYMCLERPTVTNPVGEMKLLFDSCCIGLLAEENPADFADKILMLKQDPALRQTMGRTAREIAVTRMRWSKVVDDLEACYAETREHFRTRGRAVG